MCRRMALREESVINIKKRKSINANTMQYYMDYLSALVHGV